MYSDLLWFWKLAIIASVIGGGGGCDQELTMLCQE